MATKNFLYNFDIDGYIDLNKNELRNPRLQNLGAAPGTPVVGQIYYNTGDDLIYVYTSSGWVPLDTGSGTLTLTGDVTGSGSNSGSIALTIQPDTVTYDKMQDAVANNILLGNDNGAGSTIQELTAAEVRTMLNVADGATIDQTLSWSQAAHKLTLTGDAAVDTVISLAGTGATSYGVASFSSGDFSISSGQVSVKPQGIDYAQIQNVVSNNVLLGNDNGAGSTVQELTASEVRTILDVSVTGDTVLWSEVIDDDTMATASDTTVATSESIKAYVDSSVAGGLVYQGGYNAATNTPDLDTSPSGVTKGDTYTVTAAGTFFTENVQVGDMLISEVDNPTVLADWTIVNKNIPDIVDATETAKGLVEEATQAEVNAGTVSGSEARLYVNPSKLAAWPGSANITTLGTVTSGDVAAILPNATTTVKGIVEVATQTEVNNGTATGGTGASLVVTPATLTAWFSGVSGATKYSETIGGSTTIAVTHGLGSTDVISQLRYVSNDQVVEVLAENTDANTTTFYFNTAPAASSIRAVIIG